jgi:hypothetical protein
MAIFPFLVALTGRHACRSEHICHALRCPEIKQFVVIRIDLLFVFNSTLFEICTFILFRNKADKYLLLLFYKPFKRTVYKRQKRESSSKAVCFFETTMTAEPFFWTRHA